MDPSPGDSRLARGDGLPVEVWDDEAGERAFLASLGRLLDRLQQEISTAPDLRDGAGEQAQTLVERLLVLFFVQAKGLLDASSDYFRLRYFDGHASRPEDTSFYRQVLYPLLLAVGDREANRALAGSVGTVPFLGGVFLDHPRPPARLPVTNAAFGVLFDELLQGYAWTLGGDGLPQGVGGVGPEMLGRVFERLVLEAAQGPDGGRRRATGSYYTPGPVVAFMVREALAEYLAGRSDVDPPTLARLIDLPPAAGLDSMERAWLIAAFSPGEARDLKRLLLDLRACDPSAGAGAFLMGLLQAMARTVGLLDWRLGGEASLTRHTYAYELKKHLVARCLYGVDLQARAVRICKLRLWLELLAEYELPQHGASAQALQQVPPLEDVACQVRQGDSLLEGPIRTEPGAGVPDVGWWTDPPVFGERGGFDLLVGNPPYGTPFAKDDWARIKARYAGAGSARNQAAAFLVLAFDWLNAGGVACQIVPKSLSFSRGWGRTRAVLWDRGRLLASADASQAFHDVLLEQEVVLYRPSGPVEERPRSWHLRGETFVEGHRLPLVVLKRQDAILNHLSAGSARLLERLFEDCQPLANYTRTARGASWQSHLIPGTGPHSGARVIRGRDIRQFAVAEDLPSLRRDALVEKKLQAMAGAKIVSQNIVAHLTQPYDTLVILSAVDRSGAAALDTVNMTTPRPGCPYPLEYLLALLNSSLARWYFYFAVYNRAVRTVHFDAPYVNGFPVAPASPRQVRHVCRLVEALAAAQRRRQTKYLLPGDDATYDALDEVVFDLYGLSPGEVELVLRRRG